MTKKIIYIVIASIALGVVMFMFKLKNWIKNIKFGLAQGVHLQKIGLTEIKVYLPLWFYNPSPIEAVISDLNLKIFFDGYYISSVKSPKNYMLASRVNSTYPLEITLSTGQILNYIADRGYVINDPDWLEKVEITIIGSVTFDLGIIKMRNFPIKIEDNLKSYLG